MAASTTMTIRVDAETKTKLDELAAATRRSRSFLAAEALAAYVDQELALIEDIRGSIADMEAGRLVPHEEATARIREVIAAARRKRAG